MATTTTKAPDVLIANEGTVFTFCPLSPAAKQWVKENVQADSQRFGNVLVVEHRLARGLAMGMKDAGLVLQRNNFDPITVTPSGGVIWRDYDNPGRPVVTHGDELPQDMRARREKKGQ